MQEAEVREHSRHDGGVRDRAATVVDAWTRDGAGLAFLLVVACQLATVALTWDLWAARTDPPTLPVATWLPSVSMGPAMVASLLAALVWRRPGTVIHVVVLAAAVLLDQTRLQPTVASMALLLVAIAFPALAVMGRAHLVTLWTWAGVHKLLSTGFATETAPFVADGLGVPEALARWGVPAAEIGLGLLAATWVLRRQAVAAAAVVHLIALVVLVRQGWNPAVWPWNVALPVAAAHLLTVPRGDILAELRGRPRPRAAVMAGTVWLVAWAYPAGFYLGISDAYPSHNLYTSNVASAQVCLPTGPATDVSPDDLAAATCRRAADLLPALGTSLPPEPRLFRQWFEATCAPPEVLVVRSIRTRVTTDEVTSFPCPDRRGP